MVKKPILNSKIVQWKLLNWKWRPPPPNTHTHLETFRKFSRKIESHLNLKWRFIFFRRSEEDRREEDEIKKILKGGSEESEEEEYVYSTEESFDKKWGKGRKKRSPVRTLPPGSPWKWMCPEPHQPPTDQDVNCIMSQFNWLRVLVKPIFPSLTELYKLIWWSLLSFARYQILSKLASFFSSR